MHMVANAEMTRMKQRKLLRIVTSAAVDPGDDWKAVVDVACSLFAREILNSIKDTYRAARQVDDGRSDPNATDGGSSR